MRVIQQNAIQRVAENSMLLKNIQEGLTFAVCFQEEHSLNA